MIDHLPDASFASRRLRLAHDLRDLAEMAVIVE